MQILTSRWNREKAGAIKKTRVFGFEERDDCLILTKRLATVSRRTVPILSVALLFIIWGWVIYRESPDQQLDWLAPITHTLIGLVMFLVPIWEMWRAYRGDVWVFDRRNQQIKHCGLLIMSLRSLEKVEMQRVTDSENPDYYALSISGNKQQFEWLDQNGSAREYLEVGQRIADFVDVPFVKRNAD